MPKNKVRIITQRCKKYEYGEDVLFEALDSINAPMTVSGARVLIKVNLMLGAEPELGTNTHPEIVAALVRYVRMQGGEAVVADSSGALGLTGACFERSGMAAAVEKAKGRCKNLDAGPMEKVNINGRRIREIVLNKTASDFDLVISAAKLKVHPLTGMTGAVKNFMGMVPGAVKPWVHYRLGRTPSGLSDALLDLYSYYKPAISVMDGIICREAGGSTSGRAKHSGLLAVSTDGLALDAFCTDLIGIDRSLVPYLEKGMKRKLGEIRPEGWEISGNGPIQSGSLGFEPAPIDSKANPLICIAAYWLRGHAVRPTFAEKGCGSCDDCVRSCPVGALLRKGESVIRNRTKCAGCYCCVHTCKSDVAKLKVAAYAKRAFWKKAKGLEPNNFIK